MPPVVNLERQEKPALIEHVDEYPAMHYFGIPRHTQSMMAYTILTEYFWTFQ